MIKTRQRRRGLLAVGVVLCILLSVFFACESDPEKETVVKPTATPAAGEVAGGAPVTLATATEGAEIWYTTDGSAPAKGGKSSTRYSSPIAITAAVTIKAIAVKDGMNDSAVLEAAYTVTPPPEGINGFPAALTMGVPFNLRENITINLPDAPDKTFDDIVWARTSNGTAFPTTQIVIEDDLFIPVTFFTSTVTVYAIVIDGEGEGFDYTEEFETEIVFPLNPFIGTWQGGGKTWEFKTDGTYGIDSSPNTGSFAVWSGSPSRRFLVIVEGDPAAITAASVAARTSGSYQPYCFEESGNTITITPIVFDYHAASNKQDPNPFGKIGTPITLTRQSGEPAALDLSLNDSASMMIGRWSGGFGSPVFDFSTGTTVGNGSITYYADGRVQQNYEGAWLKRGAVFVTVGNDGRRWDPPALADWDIGTALAMPNTPQVVRIHEYRSAPGEPYSRQTNTTLFWRLLKAE